MPNARLAPGFTKRRQHLRDQRAAWGWRTTGGGRVPGGRGSRTEGLWVLQVSEGAVTPGSVYPESLGHQAAGGSATRAGGGRGVAARWGRALEEGLSRAASGSGGSALPRSVHLGESCSRERISESSAATAMRGARGAWDLLCVLFVLLRGQTGGRARQARGLNPPPRGCNPGSGRGTTSRGAFRVVTVGFSSACALQPVRRWRAAAGLCWPPRSPAPGAGSGGRWRPGAESLPGVGAAGEFGDAFVPVEPGWQWRAASGFAPRESSFSARRGHGFLLLKVACG